MFVNHAIILINNHSQHKVAKWQTQIVIIEKAKTITFLNMIW